MPHLLICLHFTESLVSVPGERNEGKKGRGPNSREDITNPAESPSLCAQESLRLAGNAYSCNWKQMFSVFQAPAIPVSGAVRVSHKRVA